MAPQRSGSVVAAFDVDGTLTRRDTLLPFLATVRGRANVLAALAAESYGLARAAAPGGDRNRVKERLLTRLLAGRPYDEVARAGRAFGARVAERAISPQMRDRITWHRAHGHAVVLVSASLDVYLEEVARSLGADHLECTSLEIDDAGRCTGRIAGTNCRGPEKAARLAALLQRELTDAQLWAYGDSRGDRDMLAMAHRAVRVRRGRMRGAIDGEVQPGASRAAR